MNNYEESFGLEPFDLEALDRLIAERQCQGHMLTIFLSE
jgi:hypothetical protein